MSILERLHGASVPTANDIAKMRERAYRPSPEVVWTTLRGETVLFHIGRGMYESLNDVATGVWEVLTSTAGARFDDIVRRIVDEYEVPPDVGAEGVAQDVARLLVRFAKAQVIVVAQP